MFDIQLAIDQAPIGSTLVVPPGVYDLTRNPELRHFSCGYWNSAALRINKPLTLDLSGVMLRVKTGDLANSYGAIWVSSTCEVHIIGGLIIGNEIPTDGYISSRIGVMFTNCHHCTVYGTHTKNLSQGVDFFKSDYCSAVSVESEYNFGSGIISNLSVGNIITNCTVKNSSDGCISLYGDAVGGRNVVSYCTIIEDRGPGHLNEQGITVENEKDSTVIHNRIEGMYYSIDIKNGCKDILAQYNECYDYVYGITLRDGDGGLNTRLPSNGVDIRNNITTTPRLKPDLSGPVWPNRGIYVHYGVGANHIITENIVPYKRIVSTDKEIAGDYSYPVYDDKGVFLGNIDIVNNFLI